MSKELFEKVTKEVYIVPVFVSVHDAICKEANLDIKPLVENIEKFSDAIYNLDEANTRELVSGFIRVYDVQAAAQGRLGILRGIIHKYIEKSIMDFKKKENRFFKPATNDIRDIFSVDDVKEIFKISKVYYNGDIKNLIKQNLPQLVDEYLAKEISGVYVFTRAGVQLLLNDATKLTTAENKGGVTFHNTAPNITLAVSTKAEQPAIRFDKEEENDVNSYYLKSSSMNRDLENFIINDINPYVGGHKTVSTPVHKVDDYRRVLLNLIWYFPLYMGIDYFFNENVNDSVVCATQTKNLLIFNPVGLKRLLKTYYALFYRKDATFSLKDFIEGVKDMGYLPDKHTLCHSGKEVKDVLVFDKNIIAKYIFDNRLIDLIPSYERYIDWWKHDINSNAFNAVGASNEFIDLARKYNLINREFVPVDNSSAVIKIDYPTHANSIPAEEEEEVVEPEVEEVVKEEPKPVAIPTPSTDFDKVVYDARKAIFLSDIVNWVVDNSDTDEDEKNRVSEVFKSIRKYNPECQLYKNATDLNSTIRGFDGIYNPVVFPKH